MGFSQQANRAHFSPPFAGIAGGAAESRVPAAAAATTGLDAVMGNQDRTRHRIVIAAGGTGGHFYPAEATAAELLRRGHDVSLMCDSRSGGLDSAVFAGRDRYVLAGAGIAGRGAVRAARAVGSLAKGTIQASAILRRIDAAAVVAFGGYPSVAPIVGASLLGRRPKMILHEQNAVLGRANRLLARRADVLALSFEHTTRVPSRTPSVVTGNPVRPGVVELGGRVYAAPSDGERVEICVVGGSLGARALSDVVPQALASLPQALRARMRVAQQCRPEDLDRVRLAYDAAGIEADLRQFFPDIAKRLDVAHLVICRAGASTVAELAIVGRPAIFVPLPGAIDDHQTANARALAGAGGGWLMPQSEFTPASLAQRVADLLDHPSKLADAAAYAASLAQIGAASRLADLVEATISGNGHT